MHHAFKLEEEQHSVELSRSAKAYRLHFNDQLFDIDLKDGIDGRAWLSLGERRIEVAIARHGDNVYVHIDGESYQLRYQHPLDRLAAAGGGSAEDSILAPMPGSVISVSVKAGETVKRGQILLVMESMKMETTIISPRDAVIASVTFESGQTFDRDAVLLSLEPQEKAE